MGLIALGYAAVLGYGAGVLYMRHLAEIRDPSIMASAGMYAFAEGLDYLFLALLLMIPTAFLLRLVARFETLYNWYSRLVLAVSLTAPFGLGIFIAGQSPAGRAFSLLCFLRLSFAPLTVVGIGISRLAARFDRAKRLTSYALWIEGAVTLIAVLILILVPWHPRT